MLQSVEGVYRNGKVELLEPAPQGENTRVVVTFFPAQASIDLAARGIDLTAAGDLRSRLGAFGEDWNRPEMDVYDEI